MRTFIFWKMWQNCDIFQLLEACVSVFLRIFLEIYLTVSVRDGAEILAWFKVSTHRAIIMGRAVVLKFGI